MILGISAFVGLLLALLLGAYFAHSGSNQNVRNRFIQQENILLDGEIKEIINFRQNFRQNISSLKVCQQAVVNLQGDRNQPVYLINKLVKQVPKGIYLRSFQQDGQHVVLNGDAKSNEPGSELLRNLSNNSPGLEHPDLIEILAA